MMVQSIGAVSEVAQYENVRGEAIPLRRDGQRAKPG